MVMVRVRFRVRVRVCVGFIRIGVRVSVMVGSEIISTGPTPQQKHNSAYDIHVFMWFSKAPAATLPKRRLTITASNITNNIIFLGCLLATFFMAAHIGKTNVNCTSPLNTLFPPLFVEDWF